MNLHSKPELLAPAGTLEKLKWAVAYGADAVYFGLEFGSLRSFAGNLTLDDAEEGLGYLHARGKKGYVTLNIYPFSEEIDRLADTACTLDAMGVDGLIVADLGLLAVLRQRKLKAALHISTQANTTNAAAALAYARLGAARVNLARELSLTQIQDICTQTRGQIETEVFIHGAVCFSYSGRCAISDYLTGSRANRGECKHPCRWKYALVEETRPGDYMPVMEDERGLYLFNSKELALFDYIPALCKMGVGSLKIEGRMKSIHYLAAVVSLYRRILDGTPFTSQQALAWLGRVPNRGYSAGFIKGSITPDDYEWNRSNSEGDSLFVGEVEAMSNAKCQMLNVKGDGCIIRVRNKIRAGQTLEVLTPDGALSTLTLPDPLETVDGLWLDTVQNEQRLRLPTPLPPYSLLRALLD
ncbi:MAG: U32 family peptidase [Phycisphaerae bacterium]|nr:U32 family peptidase [Phycisphaerae bacterium]